jgi:hypothetical protein
MRKRGASVPTGARRGAPTILGKFEPVEFDENTRRIHVDFGQKLRLIANDSFNAVC